MISKVDGLPKEVKPAKVAKAAVVGAGTMGGGIAMCFAEAGIDVTLIEMSKENLGETHRAPACARAHALARASARAAAATSSGTRIT